ncbi:MAG: hypothetical protein IKA02_04195 [Clostridia bacterium]|nr:hypothetical protein [Clostridia bacterium]
MENETIGCCKECGIMVNENNVYSKYPVVICQNCHETAERKKEEEKNRALASLEYDRQRMRTKRNISMIVGGIFALAILVFLIVDGTGIEPMYGSLTSNIIGGIVSAYVVFAFVASLFFDGVVRDVLFWMATRSVRFPGLIFELDLDGILWYITVKLLFGILGFLVDVLFAILGVFVAMFIAPFTYPFSLIHQQKCIKNGDIEDFE